MSESSRIARKPCKNLKSLVSNDYEALLIPGGLGAYKHLYENEDARRTMKNIIKNFHSSKKPIICVCIAPKMVAKCIEECEEMKGTFKLTVGSDPSHFDGLKKINGQSTNYDVIACKKLRRFTNKIFY